MLLLNKTLLRMARGLWGWICLITALKMVSLAAIAGFAGAISAFLGQMDSPELTVAQAAGAILYALLAAVVVLISELLIGEGEYRCTVKARQNLRQSIFSKVLELDVEGLEKLGAVSVITTSVDGAEAMTIYYSKYLPGLFYSLMAPVYLFFKLRSLSLPVAAVLFACSFVLMPVNNLFRKHIEELKGDYWSSLEDLTGHYLEGLRGLNTLKLFCRDEHHTEVLQQKARQFNKIIMDVMKVNFSSFLLTDGLMYASILGALLITGRQLAAGQITFTAALTILLLSFGFFSSVRQLMNVTHSALTGVAAASGVEKLLQTDTSRPYRPDLALSREPFHGIEVSGVTFAYEGRQPTLQDVSLRIAHGKTTALVGLSGCGKSTLALLLMRFADPRLGHIRIDGRDYLSLRPEELRRHIIMVPQSVSLFSGTIADNLRIAAPGCSDEELLKALEQVRLKAWVLAQPQGLESDVGDAGARLSGGQRQKIGIARALLSKAEYIIFDEATSSVDVDSEREIWNCIHELSESRTLILISHRLSSIRDADCICVLSGGGVQQCGVHAQLMEQSGLYRRLVEEQEALERQGEVHICA